jgi:hypothetical protein
VDSATYKELDNFMAVFERVRGDYVEKVDDKVLIKGAIDGMLGRARSAQLLSGGERLPHAAHADRRQLRRPGPYRHDGGRRGQDHRADGGHARVPRRA